MKRATFREKLRKATEALLWRMRREEEQEEEENIVTTARGGEKLGAKGRQLA